MNNKVNNNLEIYLDKTNKRKREEEKRQKE